MSPSATANACNLEEKIWSNIVSVFNMTLLFCTFFFIYKFIVKKNKDVSLGSETLNDLLLVYSQPVYFIIVSVTLSLMIINRICTCSCGDNPRIVEVISLLISLLASLDHYSIQFILFYRVYYVFRGSSFQLSQCSSIFFGIMYTISPISYLIVAIMYHINVDLAIQMNLSSAFVSQLLTIFVIALFIYKLIQVYKIPNASSVQNGKKEYILLITKTIILVSISQVMLIIMLIFVAVATQSDNVSLNYMMKSVVSLYIFVDFMCIILSNDQFSNYYGVCCGCLDACCGILWKKCLDKRNDEKMMLQIADSVGSHSIESKTSAGSITKQSPSQGAQTAQTAPTCTDINTDGQTQQST